MSVLSFNPLPFTTGIGHVDPLSGGVFKALRAIATEIRARRAARQVESLSDEVLHDMGIARAEIDQAVRFGRPTHRR